MNSKHCLIACLWVVFLLSVSWSANFAPDESNLPHAAAGESSQSDPNRGPSEFNHHMAGYALIGVGGIVVLTLQSSRLRGMRLIWPLLFVLAGVFLAVWSDAEIWPRGNLNWAWLFHHDREAGQHKIYALLLIVVGCVEYLRALGKLRGFWRVWSFPVLAVIGAGLLLVHDHGQGGGGHSPEARAYLVNAALDCDGKPWPGSFRDSQSANTDTHSHASHESMQSAQGIMQHPMNHEDMDRDPADAASGLTGGLTAPTPQHTARTDSVTDTGMPVADPPVSSMMADGGHHHLMTPAMLIVNHEHFWFMIVGFAIALFKFISDADLLRGRLARFATYLWPSAIVSLGVLLTLYRE